MNHAGVELSLRSLEIFSIEFSNSFTFSSCSRNMAGRFRSPKSKEEETSLVSEATPKTTQYNTKWGRKVFEEWQQRRQNTSAKLEVVGVAEMNCEDVEDLTVPLEHMSPNTLNFWLSKFVCEVAKQNGERYPPNSLYLLVCAINRHLSETGGENSLNVLNKADKRQVKCYVL